MLIHVDYGMRNHAGLETGDGILECSIFSVRTTNISGVGYVRLQNRFAMKQVSSSSDMFPICSNLGQQSF